MNEIKIDKDKIGITFGYPYIVFISDKMWGQLGLKDEDIVQMNFGGEIVVAKAKNLGEFDYRKDIHALFYAIFHNFGKIPDELEKVIEDHISGEALLIHTPDQLCDFVDKIQGFLNENFWDDKEILVGCGFFEIFLKGGRELENIVNTPLFQIDKPTFDILMKRHYPSPDKISKYRGKVITPEKVYFCSTEQLLSGVWKDKAIEEIKNQEIFTAGDYMIPSPVTVHGPLVYDADLNDEEEMVYRIKPESVELLASSVGSIRPTVTLDVLHKILAKLAKESGFEIEKASDGVKLIKGNELFFFTPVQDEILFQPTHIPAERRDFVTSLIEQFIQEAQKQIGKNLEFSQPIYYELEPEMQSNKWILDTCVVCLHENVESILDLVIPIPFFYRSSFIIPEAVLYEVNRKKEEKQLLCEKGVNNLELLKILADLGFFELAFPKSEAIFLSSGGQIIREVGESIRSRLPSALVDFIVLRHVDDKSTFVTKDRELEKLAGTMGKRVLNAEDYIPAYYKDIQIYERYRDEFKKAIYGKIDSGKRTTLNDLVEAAEEFLRARETKEEGYTGRKRSQEIRKIANRIINKMVKVGELIEVTTKDGLSWEKSSIKQVLLDWAMLEKIQPYLRKDRGYFYFSPNLLEKVRKRGGLAKDVIPTLEVAIPKAFITYAFSHNNSEIIEGVEILKKVKNGRFKWIDTPQVSELSQDLLRETAFKLCEEDHRILISTDDRILRVARLRDIRCVKASSE